MRYLIMALTLLIATTATAADFRHADWGMSRADVIKSEGKKPFSNDKNGIAYFIKLAGMDCMAGFMFDRNERLFRGVYVCTRKDNEVGHTIDDYNKIEALLTEKYGSGKNYDKWYRDRSAYDSPEHLRIAVQLGYVEKTTIRKIGGNIVGHTLKRNGRRYPHLILYQQRKEGEQNAKKNKQQALDAL